MLRCIVAGRLNVPESAEAAISAGMACTEEVWERTFQEKLLRWKSSQLADRVG